MIHTTTSKRMTTDQEIMTEALDFIWTYALIYDIYGTM